MKTENRNNNKYITHVVIRGHRIIPSNNFKIDEDKYLLLEILKSSEDESIYLKIICVEGVNKGNVYFVPKSEFENKSLKEMKFSLEKYKH